MAAGTDGDCNEGEGGQQLPQVQEPLTPATAARTGDGCNHGWDMRRLQRGRGRAAAAANAGAEHDCNDHVKARTRRGVSAVSGVALDLQSHAQAIVRS